MTTQDPVYLTRTSFWGLIRALANDRAGQRLNIVAHEVSKTRFGGEHVNKLVQQFTHLLVLCGHQTLSLLDKITALFCSRKRERQEMRCTMWVLSTILIDFHDIAQCISATWLLQSIVHWPDSIHNGKGSLPAGQELAWGTGK